MDDLANYCFNIYRSQEMSYLGAIRDNYDTMLILRGVAPSIRTYVVNRRVIWIPPDGIL